jgi:PAS domain S-box-containing protein
MNKHPTHQTGEDRHAAAFYRTSGELLDILVPFFKKGLEEGQSCLWLVPPSLRLDDAKCALARAVGNDKVFVRKGQLEFVSTEEWYTENGTFVANRSIFGIEKHRKQAVVDGYQGLRVSGDTSWLPMRDWDHFQDYELQIQQQPVTSSPSIRILCTYSLERCRSPEIIDVLCRHDSSVVHDASRWQHYSHGSTDTASGGPLWDTLTAMLTESLIELDENGTIRRCNQEAEAFSGYAQAEMLHMPLYFLIDSHDQERVAFFLYQLKRGYVLRNAHVVSRRRDGSGSPISLSILPVIGDKKVVSRGFAVLQKLP